jgi:hypothetical protein
MFAKSVLSQLARLENNLQEQLYGSLLITCAWILCSLQAQKQAKSPIVYVYIYIYGTCYVTQNNRVYVRQYNIDEVCF